MPIFGTLKPWSSCLREFSFEGNIKSSENCLLTPKEVTFHVGGITLLAKDGWLCYPTISYYVKSLVVLNLKIYCHSTSPVTLTDEMQEPFSRLGEPIHKIIYVVSMAQPYFRTPNFSAIQSGRTCSPLWRWRIYMQWLGELGLFSSQILTPRRSLQFLLLWY